MLVLLGMNIDEGPTSVEIYRAEACMFVVYELVSSDVGI